MLDSRPVPVPSPVRRSALFLPPDVGLHHLDTLMGCGRLPVGARVDVLACQHSPLTCAEWWFLQEPAADVVLTTLPDGRVLEFRRQVMVRTMIRPRLGLRRRVRRFVRRLVLGHA